jgi:hypothetical protein
MANDDYLRDYLTEKEVREPVWRESPQVDTGAYDDGREPMGPIIWVQFKGVKLFAEIDPATIEDFPQPWEMMRRIQEALQVRFKSVAATEDR